MHSQLLGFRWNEKLGCEGIRVESGKEFGKGWEGLGC